MTSNATVTSLSSSEEDSPLCFGEWLKRRRQALDLTQEQLAQRACCSVFAIRKIEMGERRPSKQLAGLLAQSLEIPPEDQAAFIKAARGELSVERLASLARAPARDSQPAARSGAVSGNLPKPAPGSLPRVLTPFIGREPELSALGRLLREPQCLLLTIVGSGGVGKTRLAIEAAGQCKDCFPDGAWFVPLAPLNSPALLVPAIAEALNFRFQDRANPKAELLRYLREKKALLLMDNAEHLLDGVDLFAEILRDCPGVKLLVTSRERLDLLSEWVFEILGLPVPPGEQAEQFAAYSAVALFLQSARRVQAGFALRQEERGCVLKICMVLEGMPLGIELAAAWVGLLTCGEIAAEIERNIDFLAVSMRDLPERHRSLRATLDYSWKLLAAEQKLILSRLSVFHGRFRREAAEEICGASLAVLASLRNKMLLYRTDDDFYSLHEIIRQYAELRLREDPDEDERVKDRHASYYVRCLSEDEQALKSNRQVETFNEMARVIEDLSRGWLRIVTSLRPNSLVSEPFPLDRFNNALFSLSLFYEMRNRSLEAIPLFKEAIAYLRSVESAFESPEDRSVYSTVLGHITAYLGLHHIYLFQYEQARVYLEEAIRLLDQGQSRVVRAQAQVMLAATYSVQGQLQKDAALLEQSLEVFREEGDRWWYLLSTINLAPAYVSLGKLSEIEAFLQEGLGLLEPGDFRLGMPLRMHYAFVLNLKKDYARAEQVLQESLTLSDQYGNTCDITETLFELGRTALATQRIELAEAYLQKSIKMNLESGRLVDLSMHRLYLGKCFAARHDLPAARDQFRQVVKIGQSVDRPHMVYWGLVGIARIYMEEGQAGKALAMALALRHFPVEYIRLKEEGDRLLADLQAGLPEGQFEAAMQQVDGLFSPDPAGANALAYALARDRE